MAFTAKGFTLYSHEVTLKGGRKQVIYFFSRHTPKAGSPSELPAGYKVGVNTRTGLPYLKSLNKKPAPAPKPKAAKKTSKSSKAKAKTPKVGKKMPPKKKAKKAAKRKTSKKAAKRKAPKKKKAAKKKKK
jgi:hypothetical protein